MAATEMRALEKKTTFACKSVLSWPEDFAHALAAALPPRVGGVKSCRKLLPEP